MKNNRTPKIRGAKKVTYHRITKEQQKKFDSECEHTIEYRKGYKWNQRPDATYRYMTCKRCGQFELVGETATSVICHECVNEMVEPPQYKSVKKSDRPAGWHFMKEFVDKDGTVYHRGKEQPKLKGTLKPTTIEPKKRLTKKEKDKLKQYASSQIFDLKKQLKKARWKKDKRKLMSEIKYHTRVLNNRIPKDYQEKISK
tara:strand:+ start:344 stop:940 length:597 start_codon:yes stop_codon:yes gene_type:complete